MEVFPGSTISCLSPLLLQLIYKTKYSSCTYLGGTINFDALCSIRPIIDSAKCLMICSKSSDRLSDHLKNFSWILKMKCLMIFSKCLMIQSKSSDICLNIHINFSWTLLCQLPCLFWFRICWYSSCLFCTSSHRVPLHHSPWQRKPVLPWVNLPPVSWLSPMVKQQPWNMKLNTSASPRSLSLMEVCMKRFRVLIELTHGSRDKMAAISQTTFSNAFSWIKMFQFWIKFRWSCSIHLTIF